MFYYLRTEYSIKTTVCVWGRGIGSSQLEIQVREFPFIVVYYDLGDIYPFNLVTLGMKELDHYPITAPVVQNIDRFRPAQLS